MAIALDTSALVAIVLGESEAEMFATVIMSNIGDAVVGAATLVDATLVLEARQGPSASADLGLLIAETRTATVPLDAKQAALAVAAWRRFGKGNHPASLNLGDCFSYAVSKATGFPLLFKGKDFTQTDIASAV